MRDFVFVFQNVSLYDDYASSILRRNETIEYLIDRMNAIILTRFGREKKSHLKFDWTVR